MNKHFIIALFYSASFFGADNTGWLPKKALRYFNEKYNNQNTVDQTHANYAAAITRLYMAKIPKERALSILFQCSPSNATKVDVFWRNFIQEFRKIKREKLEDKKFMPTGEAESSSDVEERVVPSSCFQVRCVFNEERLDPEVFEYTQRFQGVYKKNGTEPMPIIGSWYLVPSKPH